MNTSPRLHYTVAQQSTVKKTVIIYVHNLFERHKKVTITLACFTPSEIANKKLKNEIV